MRIMSFIAVTLFTTLWSLPTHAAETGMTTCQKEVQENVETIEERNGNGNHIELELSDIDNDGRYEILWSERCSGNSCLPSLYMYWFNSFCVREGFSFNRWNYVFEGWTDVNFSKEDDYVYMTAANINFEIPELNKTFVTYKFTTSGVRYVSSEEAEPPDNLAAISAKQAMEQLEGLSVSDRLDAASEITLELKFDLNGDSKEETISCGYWDRWSVLDDCKILTSDNTNILAIEYFSAKILGVSSETRNGWNVLISDYGDLIAYELGHGYKEVAK